MEDISRDHHEPLPDKDSSVCAKRKFIRKYMLENRFLDPMLLSTDSVPFSTDDLKVLFELYDKHTFKGELSRMSVEKGHTIEFGEIVSNSKAGDHTQSGNKHTIRISKYMIGKLFTNGEKTIKSNGLIVSDRLGALLNIFEHELTHLYCSLKGYTRKIKSGPGKMYYSPHGKLFQELVFRLFGHTNFWHNFDQGEAADQLDRSECHVGMYIYFDSNIGRVYGRIFKVNSKRCKVDTEDGSTFDVPYSMLRKADRDVTVPKKKSDNSREKYRVGMNVRFKHKRKYLCGKIIKCNPKRARVETNIGIYNVDYISLK